MAFLEKFLFTKRSQIRQAGKGLFTKINIHKGTCIVEYKGRLENWKDVIDEDGYNGYLLRVDARYAINALPCKKALGRFANDAKGNNRVGGLSNNAEYLIEGKRCFIYATKGIKKGEEILVSYGRDYWNLIKNIENKLRQ